MRHALCVEGLVKELRSQGFTADVTVDLWKEAGVLTLRQITALRVVDPETAVLKVLVALCSRLWAKSFCRAQEALLDSSSASVRTVKCAVSSLGCMNLARSVTPICSR